MSIGDRDYKQIVRDAIDSIGEDVELKIDSQDPNAIYLDEVTKCLRRSYYDRKDPLHTEQTQFNKVLGGLFRKMKSHSTIGKYDMDGGLELKGQVDMIKDDVVMIFRSVHHYPENPLPVDILYLNACMWIFEKLEGIITYITPDPHKWKQERRTPMPEFHYFPTKIDIKNQMIDTTRYKIISNKK